MWALGVIKDARRGAGNKPALLLTVTLRSRCPLQHCTLQGRLHLRIWSSHGEGRLKLHGHFLRSNRWRVGALNLQVVQEFK